MIARLERFGPLAGVAAAALWLVGVLVVQGGNPADPKRAEELAAYFRDDRTPILLGGLLVGLGTFLFFWFLAALAQRLSGWLSTAALIGGTAGGAMMLALTGPHTTGATTDKELLGPESSLALWRLTHTFFVAAEVAFAVFVAAVALHGLQTRLLPRWLAWAGLPLALLLLVIPVAWLALIFLLPLWLAAVGLVLYRRPAAAEG
jgi:hypothetical protein